MSDPFRSHSSGLESPAAHAAAIAPSDTADLPVVPRALYCTGDGIVRITPLRGSQPVDLPVVFGVPLPVRPRRVWATGTTAVGLVGVW